MSQPYFSLPPTNFLTIMNSNSGLLTACLDLYNQSGNPSPAWSMCHKVVDTSEARFTGSPFFRHGPQIQYFSQENWYTSGNRSDLHTRLVIQDGLRKCHRLGFLKQRPWWKLVIFISARWVTQRQQPVVRYTIQQANDKYILELL